MDRAEYNKCMIPYMKGGGEDRKLRFCVGAKLCSGKAKTEEEAREICLIPKPPKEKKTRKSKKGSSCEDEAIILTQCVVKHLEDERFYKDVQNINSVGQAIANALMECKCQN